MWSRVVMKWQIGLLTVLMILTGCNQDGNSSSDNVQPVEKRVEDLLAKMNLDEKIGQMTQVDRKFLKDTNDIQKYFLGSLLSGGGSAPDVNAPENWADMIDGYQKIALGTRLAIPLIYGIDAVHGNSNVYGAVIFPHNIGLGCTGNPALVEEAMRVTAEEVAGTGINWNFAPCVAVPRDERWGRTYEGFGETPELVKQMGGFAVRGLQGTNLDNAGSILACAKHFIGDGGTAGGVDQGDTQLDQETLFNIHLQGYLSALEHNVGSIMISFSSWNGQKMHGHDYLINSVLRGQLGFDGLIVSDWAGIDQLPGDYKDDIRESILAGIDMIMVPENYESFITNLKALVDEGSIPMTRIDASVRRILKVKFQLGLFENPYTDRSFTASIGSEAHRQVARKCVQQSQVLLKNEANTLPLAKTVKRIHVAGKNADDLGNQCGGWTISW
ncbi:MAG: glycoside hydrolase family 3 protein, partial [Calditrichales bacterium]